MPCNEKDFHGVYVHKIQTYDVAPRVVDRFGRFKFWLKANRSKYFCDFSCVYIGTENTGKFEITEDSWM